MESDELQIVSACQKGNIEQFGKLYDRYIRKIYDFIYYKTSHQQTAEDLTSIVFMKALEKIRTFDKHTNFSAWLYRIARNTVIDHYRTQKFGVNIDDVWDLSSNDNLDINFDSREKLKEVKKYLGNLKSEQRDVIIMRVWQEMSYSEISAVIGKSESSCKMTFSRAIRELRQEMPLALFIMFIHINIFVRD
ncbi:MAG: RNA polymerase sigma factor [bacterium]|nr:RNA polymerase sigma factor [bacterium]